MTTYPRSLLALCAMSTALVLASAWPVQARDLPGPPAVAIQERLTQARADIYAGNWALALGGLRDAALEEPGNADVHNLLGYTYRKQAAPNLPKAFEHYKTALSLNPRHKGAHEYIGEAYLMDKKPQEAEKHLVELEKICGNKTCEEYADLAKAIADYKARK